MTKSWQLNHIHAIFYFYLEILHLRMVASHFFGMVPVPSSKRRCDMKTKIMGGLIFALILHFPLGYGNVPNSYIPVDDKESLDSVKKRMAKEKPKAEERFRKLLQERYDLADRPMQGITASRGKSIQAGVRTKLPKNTTWDSLAAMTPEEIKQNNLWPVGF